MQKNIVLIGLMGVGKSLTSAKLKVKLGWPVVSTDAVIEKREGRRIVEIFRDFGEEYFRKREREVVKEVSRKTRTIIDCGGGVFLNQDNIDCLKIGGIIFCLQAAPDVIYNRLKDQTGRPLLNVSNPLARIHELLEERKHWYAQAEHIIDTSHITFDQAADQIIGLMGLNKKS